MKVQVNKCNNCPFLVRNYDDLALGDDTLLECNLKSYLGFKTTFLGSYKSSVDGSPEIPIPDDCPLYNNLIKVSISNIDGNDEDVAIAFANWLAENEYSGDKLEKDDILGFTEIDWNSDYIIPSFVNFKTTEELFKEFLKYFEANDK